MPIEIRELYIKVTAQDTNLPAGSAAAGSSDNKEELVDACVEKVMELLKEQTNR